MNSTATASMNGTMVRFNQNGLPSELTAVQQWVCWNAVPNGNRVEKIPISPTTGGPASSTNPDTWGNFKLAMATAKAKDWGLGFVFTKGAGIVGIDLDKCRDVETGILDSWAQDIVNRMQTYTEVSPSGRGVHLYARGTLPGGKRRKGQIEAYESARFFTVTGNHLPNTSLRVEERGKQLAEFHAEYLADPEPTTTPCLTPEHPRVQLSDEEILSKCRSAKNSSKFDQLWRGDFSEYKSHSEGDMALLGVLAFYTHEPSQLDRLFRRSGLMRSKWDERHGELTYGGGSMKKALTQIRDMYAPNQSNGMSVLSGSSEDDPSHQTSTVIASEETTVIPLDDVTLPPFPIDAFPDPLRSMIERVAKATETPVELGAMMGLTTIATCCQKCFEVVIDDSYREPLSLWGVSALESGNRKTAVHQKLTEPIRVKERELCEQSKAVIAQAESKRATTEARVKVIRARIANSEDSEDIAQGQGEIDGLLADMSDIPTAPRLWAQDITPEKLGAVMADNGERLALLSDEGGLFDILAGRYSNGVPNLDLFLQSHAGAPVRVDRGSRPPIVMHSPALTIGLSPQPGVLRGLTGKPGFRERGLLARFLYTLPQSRLGYRKLRTEPVPANVSEAYHKMMKALLEFEPTRNDYGDAVPFTIRLSPEAEQEWREFAELVEVNMRPQGLYEHLKDWAGKLPGAALRVAGLFHCAQYARQQPQNARISLETMRAAVTVLAVIGQHTKAVFDLMGADPALDGARRVWRWIEEGRKQQFTAQICFQALRGSFPRMADLNPVISLLCERGYLLAEDDSKQGPGRKSRRFNVNPVLTKGWA